MTPSVLPAYAQRDLVVFSHLRWEFVYQRPQHIMSRMSAHRKVLFIEEPVPVAPGADTTVSMRQVSPNVWVLQPQGDYGNPAVLARAIQRYLSKLEIADPILWFYSPAFLDFIPLLDHSLVIYDCMDELTKFKGASRQLSTQELELLSQTDIVLTGGKSLYEAKRVLHPRVYCFPSSVDHAHFSPSPSAKKPAIDDILALPSPRIGYYGVIDERIDTVLLQRVAQALPDIAVVMIGPVVKIHPDDLPKEKNIYYLGQKSYQELPFYLQEIDVAIMPFALNDATQFISPTKTLEFMAAGKPIVSTPIRDVVRDYASVIAIGHTPEEFSHHIRKVFTESASHRKHREDKQRRILSQTSWDETVSIMESIIHSALREKEDVSSSIYSSVGTQAAVLVQEEGGSFT